MPSKARRGAGVVDELKPQNQDIVIPKTAYSSFFGTNLDETLKRLGVDSLRLTGTVTHICVLFTASDAVLRDYLVTVVEDGVAGHLPGRSRRGAPHHARTSWEWRS